jgi:hypothetical protein
MEKDILEFNLNKGMVFGLEHPNANDKVGWIILKKTKVANNFFNKFSFNTEIDKNIINEQEQNRSSPYIVIIQEVSKDIFAKGEIRSNGDYLLNESYRFKSIDDVEIFLNSLSYDLLNIKWLSDLRYID